MSDEEREKYPSEMAERFQVRMPNGLRDRIKESAEKNNRSMNAEIVSALEEKFPPKVIDIETFVTFLENLVYRDDEEHKQYLENINRVLGEAKYPFTVRPGGDGVVSFFPYASHEKKSRKD